MIFFNFQLYLFFYALFNQCNPIVAGFTVTSDFVVSMPHVGDGKGAKGYAILVRK